MLDLSAAVLLAALALPAHAAPSTAAAVPAGAQVIDQRSFNVLPTVLPVTEFNGTSSPFVLSGHTTESMLEKPFHIYDDAFKKILGDKPTLTLIATSEDGDPIFHEATTWSKGTDEMYFVQNAGSPAAGTGLNKSAIVQKISLAAAAAAAAANTQGNKNGSDTSKMVTVTTVNTTDPVVVNPNGGTNFRGNIVFAAEGQGADIAPAMIAMNPRAPYNTTTLINNYFGRQFNSPNDVTVHPVSKDLYFTDTLYGFLQGFRPALGLPNQVYRWVEATGALTVVADGFDAPNGIVFTPDGKHVYIGDSGMQHGDKLYDHPATIYRYRVEADGTFSNRKVFAYTDNGVPDGIHVDTNGNVYAGCGDGVQVWNPSGTLLGKIYLGTGAANFAFAGKGRMVVCSETELYYVTLAAEGFTIASEM